MNWQEYIEQRPDVMLGKPVVRGTRLTVEMILEGLAEGATETDLLAAYPRLRLEHIHAALAFAAASSVGSEADELATEVELLRRNHAFLAMPDEFKEDAETIPLSQVELALR